MFQITRDPSSGSFIQYLAYGNGSIRHNRTITVILAKHCKASWWWIPCDPKHVGAILNIIKYFIIILVVSTNYIFMHPLDNKVF